MSESKATSKGKTNEKHSTLHGGHDCGHNHSLQGGQDCGHNHALHSHDSHTHTHTHTKSVLNRLSRAIGHLSSVRGMVERGQDCSEVLIQLSAVRSAINSTCEIILKDHMEHCIVDAVKTGDQKTLDELNRAIELLMK